jgi:single-stranded-DNA-specific exonuclease
VRQVGISPLLAQCLINRDFTTPETPTGFLEPRLRDLVRSLPAPQHDRRRAPREGPDPGEPLVIYGDYDVDGVTSTALLIECSRSWAGRSRPFLPHRMDEGYGLSPDGVEHCLDQHPVS